MQAQTERGATVTMELKDEGLTSSLRQLEESSGYKINFVPGEVRDYIVTASLKGVDIRKALDVILSQTALTYTIQGNVVTISLQKGASIPELTGEIVSDEDGLPVIGATIQVEGTNQRTITDVDGKFRLKNVPTNRNVRISYVGMKTQVIPARARMLVQMKGDAQTLSEVVVTGYGNMTKGNYTGSVTTVKADDILLSGASSIDQMLQGVVPGMLVTQTTGMVGVSPKVRVRGTSSLLGSQDPVWVVDGVIQRNPQPFNSDNNMNFSSDSNDISQLAGNAISWLNPNDIETITVLKDASATAIYGSEAANGVIVITTKKAQVGKISVNYNGDFSVGQRPGYGLYNQMNSNELMQFTAQMYEDRVTSPTTQLGLGYTGLMQQLLNKEITQEQFDASYRKMAAQNTDWFSELFRNSFTHKHTVSISGGSEKVQNRTSFGYNEDNGEAKGNSSTSLTVTSNTTFNLLNHKLLIDMQVNGTWRNTNGFAYGVDPFSYAYNTSRAIPLYNEDGTYYYTEQRSDVSSTVENNRDNYLYNIKNELANTGARSRTQTLGATIDAKWKFLPSWELQGLASYSGSSTNTKQWATERSTYIAALRGYDYGAYANTDSELNYSRIPFGGLLETGLTEVNTWTARASLVYDHLFDDIHRLTGQLGIEGTSTRTRGNSNTRYGYLKDRGESFVELPIQYLDVTGEEGAYLENDLVRGSASNINRTSNKLSEYATLAYTYDNRYVLNVNGRVDASNRFGQDKRKRFEPTWSVGLKWRAASEKFAEKFSWLNNFDVIASYGYQGNAVESISPYLIATDGGVNEYYNDYLLNISSLPYRDLGWEKTRSINLGIDAAFLDGRLNFSLNYYNKRSNILSSRNVPLENGVTNAYVDGGEITNKGYDFVISVVPVRTKDFSWEVSFNTTVTNNAVDKNQRVNTLSDYINGTAVVDGEAYSTFYSYEFIGLNDEDGTPQFANMDVEGGETPLCYLVKSGKFIPDFSGGFDMRFKYKNWSLYTLFTMQFGASNRLPDLYDTSSNYGVPLSGQNLSRDLLKRWRQPGDITDIPSIPTSSAWINLPNTTQVASSEGRLYTMYNQSTARVAKADFIRCRSISLSYEFDKKILNRLGVQRLMLKGSMTNPFMWVRDSRWNGLDPETADWPTRRVTSLSLQVSL
jgi:TonB-linked SusC/RagA family outer membrane protein